MEKVVEKIGLLDYVNVFFVGVIFYMGMRLLGYDAYTKWFEISVPSEPSFLKVAVIIVVCYITGVLLQAVGNGLDSFIFRYHDTAMNTFLWTEEERKTKVGAVKETLWRKVVF